VTGREPIPRALVQLTGALTRRLGDGAEVARFVIACVCTLLAEEVGVCAGGLRAGLGGRWLRRPELFAGEVAGLWAEMCAGAPALPVEVLRGCSAPTLTGAELGLLAAAAEHAWTEVEPEVLGTLLERGLAARERSLLGAFFTPRGFIERLVEPTVIEPLRDEWTRVLAAANGAGREEAVRGCRDFLKRLRGVRVLDPACGTGNFLYVALDLLRGLEAEVLAALRGLGEAAEGVVRPDQLVGIEKNRGSRDIAALVLWIGFVRRGWSGGAVPAGELIVGDAVLRCEREEDVVDEQGAPVTVRRQGKRGTGEAPRLRRYHAPRPADWPEAEFIVSNPPFIGNKRMRALLGDGYAEALRVAYAERVPGDVDLVAYWWHRAAEILQAPGSRLRRFGFITTNSVRQRQTGELLRRHLADGSMVLHFACADHPWVDPSADGDAAAVRISMTVARRADEAGARAPRLLTVVGAREEARSGEIHADLTIGADLRGARPLLANRGLCFQGMNLVGDGFRLEDEAVTAMFGAGPRPAALRRYVMGRDLKKAACPRYVIDFFGHDLEQARAAAPELFNWVETTVKGLRANNTRENYRRRWWQFGEARPGLRRALVGLRRYVATAETSRHRFFVMLDADVVPDHQLYAVASDDAYVLGVLSARPHVAWALHAGGRNGAGNDPRWTSSATFAPFPFPAATEAQRTEIRGLAERLEETRRRMLADGAGSLTRLYHRAPAELAAVHAGLDAAVLAAYGIRGELGDAELLQFLVELNRARVEEEARGEIRWIRPELQQE
jgi:hypothetical protein